MFFFSLLQNCPFCIDQDGCDSTVSLSVFGYIIIMFATDSSCPGLGFFWSQKRLLHRHSKWCAELQKFLQWKMIHLVNVFHTAQLTMKSWYRVWTAATFLLKEETGVVRTWYISHCVSCLKITSPNIQGHKNEDIAIAGRLSRGANRGAKRGANMYE
jgi:hypothetical protein